MLDLKKLFAREARARKGEAADPDSDYHPSDRKGGAGLEVEYQSLIATQFRRAGIEPGCITIEVRKIGQAPDGYDVLVGMVRLARWERTSALRVLLGLPLLETKVRKMVRGTWLADFSHFGGLWLHSSEQIQSSAGPAELRELLLQLAPPAAAAPGTDPLMTTGAFQASNPPSNGAGASEAGEAEPVSS